MSESEHTLAGSERPRWYTKWYIWICVAAAFMVVIALGLLFLDKETAKIEKSRVTNAAKVADTATANGDYKSAYEALKAAEKETSSPGEKARLYGELAAAAANNGSIGEALDYYAQRHALEPEARKADAYLVATLYERSGDMDKAIEYYRLAVEYYRSLPQNQQVRADLQGIEAYLKELESQ